MNYDIALTARKVEVYLRDRARDDDPEVPFSFVEGHLKSLDELDRTPQWVIIAAIGSLVGTGRARMRVWKRDQTDVHEVKVRYLETASTSSPSAPETDS